MSLRENWRQFAIWSHQNKLLSLCVILGSIYVATLPFTRRLPPTAQERANKRGDL